ncbi:MAG: hypothetical protein BAJALOKI1v1_380012 [Promethearchaeota archaeon]|nr:MAG: hypothetical protein BAJALOKI1v1_380012 [Candidatus Lokiarchaeota archaeon]
MKYTLSISKFYKLLTHKIIFNSLYRSRGISIIDEIIPMALITIPIIAKTLPALRRPVTGSTASDLFL